MKKLKIALLMLLTLAIALSLCSCLDGLFGGGECEHVDKDKDGICDKCDKKLAEPDTGEGVLLIDDGEFKFQIVRGGDVDAATLKIIDDFIELAEESFGAKIKLVDDKEANATDCEVLIGTVKSRGDKYTYDKYSLGAEGYAITPVDGKVIVTAGSTETLKTTVKYFFEEVLGIDAKTDEVGTVKVSDKNAEVKVQDNYRIKEVTVNGTSVKGYKIVVDYSENSKFKYPLENTARELQSFFYTKTGLYLEIVDYANFDGDDAIYLRGVAKGKAGSKGFRTRVDGKSFIIECAHYNKFDEAFSSYYNKNLAFVRDETLALKKYDSEIDITKIFYSEFGAVGDGIADDAVAIRDAHAYANEGGQTVYADYGKTYRVNVITTPIVIKTDVNWNGATIILDNSNVLAQKSGVPEVVGDYVNSNGFILVEQDIADISATPEQLAAVNALRDTDGIVLHGLESTERGASNVGFALGYPAMLTLQNSNTKNYIRYGYVDSKGSTQTELVLVDKDGNIDPSTPILNDFSSVTSIIIHRVDTNPITIENATILELSSRVNLNGGYRSIGRGIQIKRANVTLQSIVHEIEGEIDPNTPVMKDENGLAVIAEGYTYLNGKIITPDGQTYLGDDIKPFTGHSYNGIVSAWRTHNTHIVDVVFQGRVKYIEGTYDIDATYANKTVFENCTQSNFFEEGSSKIPNLSKCWGVAGTNYCKNLEYINCELTRYDAHSGVTNGKVIGGKLAVLRLIGGGEFLMDGVTVYARTSAPFQLREDYGASFNGDITVRNCTVIDAWGSGTTFQSGLFSLPATYWDMGYESFCPNITIDNLKLDTKLREIPLVVYETYTEYSSSKHFPRRNIFTSDASDPTVSGNKFHYDTKTPDKWIADNITASDGMFHGCSYETKAGSNGVTTVIVTDTVNRFVYHAPEKITVKNNANNGYILTLYKSAFFDNAVIDADSQNLKRVDLP